MAIGAQIIELWGQGLTRRSIGQNLSVSQREIRSVLNSIGVEGQRRNKNWFGELSDHQRSVLQGTLLGDGHLGIPKDCCDANLSWSHGPEQRDYLIWKASQFGKLFTHLDPSQRIEGAFQISSRVHPSLTEFYNLFYTRPDSECTEHVLKKKITPAILAQVTDEALAIWWCDDGTRQGNRLGMAAGAMTEPEYLLIENWFNGLGFDFRRDQWMDRGNCVSWYLGVEDSKRFADRIKNHVPVCMAFKLGGLKWP